MRFRKLMKLFITIFGVICGVMITKGLNEITWINNFLDDKLKFGVFGVVLSLLCGSIAFLSSGKIIDVLTEQIRKIQNLELTDLIMRSGGLIVGLLIAFLISSLVKPIPALGFIISLVFYVFFAYLGIKIPSRRQEEVGELFNGAFKNKNSLKESKKSIALILDTSVIIDGRIADILKTGFLDGTIVIPEFIVVELQHIADSEDDLKRKKGRRGLDILNMLQNEEKLEVKLDAKNFKDMEVDSKLVKLAKQYKGKILTNDFNLNKVAKVHGVQVLNINDLANAVKPIVLPGEKIKVELIKHGKEQGQGIAYFDDGTMIVVEGGYNYVGKNISVIVTSILQTSAGRMIFAKIGN